MGRVSRRPPEESSKAPHRLVSKKAFQALWASLPSDERWADFALVDHFKLENIWSFDDNCWWVLHPEE